ncbi:MAG TPA: argininosuccinate lyase [Spirochaetia bacterium]|nr:argininosuccinate lyase [Spirochaetia bacterium]
MSFSPIYSGRVLDPSYRNWRKRYQADSMRVHKAHLVMLAEQKLIPQESATEIKRGIAQLEKQFEPPQHIPNGVEDLYFLFERELGRLIGEDHAGYLHTARSRNDMDTTVFRLSLKGALLDFLDAVARCGEALLEKSRAAQSEPIVLYTHGQPANVSTLAHYLTAFLLELEEDAKRLAEAIELVDRSTMGACAITTTSFALDPQRVSSLLGLAKPVANSYQAISTSHWLTYPASACSALMVDITRFAADLGHKASSEVGILTFPDELVQVSSIMPQKRNPVIIEHIRIQAGLSNGIFAGIEQLFANVPFQDVNEVADAPVEQLYDGLALAASSLELLGDAVRGMGVDGERVRQIAVDFGTTTTELADTLVREAGISFREAHGVTQAFVRSGYRKDALREAFAKLRGKPLDYSDSQIDQLLTPDHFIAVRKVAGGPAPDGMQSVFEEVLVRAQAVNAFVAEARARRSAADRSLGDAFAQL